MKPTKQRNFGEANGWIKIPDTIKKCREAGHTVIPKKEGGRNSCLTVYICSECNYTYRIDSGG